MDREHSNSCELSADENKLFLDVVLESLEVTTRTDFESWARGSLRKLFPHQMLICGITALEDGKFSVDKLLSVDFPLEDISAARNRDGHLSCPTLSAWSRTLTPQFYDPENNRSAAPITSAFKKHRLKNVAAHGVIDAQHRNATYFSFSQIPQKLSAWHAHSLSLLVPHMHQAFVRVISNENQTIPTFVADFTEREREILHWLTQGKSNWAIGQILNRSQHTVKHEVGHVMAKLQVSTRAQAAAKILAVRPASGIGSFIDKTLTNSTLSLNW